MLKLTTMPPVATPNLVLREIAESDVHDLTGFMTQPRYQRYIMQRLRAEDEVRAFVRRQVTLQNERGRQRFHLAAEERMSGEVVGDGFIIASGHQCYEIGWGLHPALWRAGFGTEIGRALLGLAFERLKAKKVTCKVMLPNVASAALARRIGMQAVRENVQMQIEAGRAEEVCFFHLDQDGYFNLPY